MAAGGGRAARGQPAPESLPRAAPALHRAGGATAREAAGVGAGAMDRRAMGSLQSVPREEPRRAAPRAAADSTLAEGRSRQAEERIMSRECIICGERFALLDPEIPRGKFRRLLCVDCRNANGHDLLE